MVTGDPRWGSESKLPTTPYYSNNNPETHAQTNTIHSAYILFDCFYPMMIVYINKFCSELWSFSPDAWMDSHREPSMIYPARH